MIINGLTILLECITFLLCLHIGFKNKIRFSIGNILFCGVYVSVFMACTYNILDKSVIGFLVGFFLLWCISYFSANVRHSIICLIIAFLICGILQLLSMLGGYCVYLISNNIDVMKIIVEVIALVISIVIYLKIPLKKTTIANNKILFLLILPFLLLVYTKIYLEKTRTVDYIFYILVFLIIFICFNQIIKEQKYEYEIEKKNLELKLYNDYNEKYKELIKEMRIRQHDYKNQLSVISSMHITAKSLDELIEMQQKYMGILINEKSYDSVLMSCANSVLAGYIYSKCSFLDSENIQLIIDVNVCKEETTIPTYKITEVLGVMINNSYEYIIERNIERKIGLKIIQLEKEMIIEVSNPSEYISHNSINKMFEYGYSSKGVERGIGLYSVKNIVQEHNGLICVSNEIKDDTNWFVINISIPLSIKKNKAS